MNLETQAQLSCLYNQPHRYYHNIAHINACIRKFKEAWPEFKKTIQKVSDLRLPPPTYFLPAIWFHDAVYDPLAEHGQNEADSLDLAHNFCADNFVDFSIVQEFILASADHLKNQSTLRDETLFLLDIDLSGLSEDASIFNRNSMNIYKEYEHAGVPYDTYLKGRINLFEKLLAKDRIYYTKYFYDNYEDKARHNIESELEDLKRNLMDFEEFTSEVSDEN